MQVDALNGNTEAAQQRSTVKICLETHVAPVHAGQQGDRLQMIALPNRHTCNPSLLIMVGSPLERLQPFELLEWIFLQVYRFIYSGEEQNT